MNWVNWSLPSSSETIGCGKTDVVRFFSLSHSLSLFSPSLALLSYNGKIVPSSRSAVDRVSGKRTHIHPTHRH